MTTNVLWMILAFTIGLGASQPVAPSSEYTGPRKIQGDCYKNGIWYNPCPPDPEPPPPDPHPSPENQMP